MVRFRLGCSAIRWIREADWESILDEIARIGYEGTEVQQAFQAGESETERVKQALAKRGLQAVTTYIGGAFYDRDQTSAVLDRVRAGAKMMAELGADIVVVAVGGDARRRAIAGCVQPEDMLSDEQFEVLAENLNRAGEICREFGLTACLHNHAATYLETREELDRVLSMTDPDLLALCPDTAHLRVGGDDCVDFFRTYADRIRYVHLKNVNEEAWNRLHAERKGMDWFVREGGGWAELRDGCIDLPACFRILKESGYDGWLMVEQDNSPNPPDVAAANNYAYLQEVLSEL